MKKLIIILLLFILIQPATSAKSYKISPSGAGVSVQGVGFSNNKITLQTSVNGHKIRLKSPSLSKNKYLRLVNISL